MRNLAQYPIVTEECLDWIEKLIEEEKQGQLIGSTKMVCLSAIYDYVRIHDSDFETFLKENVI